MSDTITVRMALREAMSEEMQRDPTVFVMGEEVALYEGAYKITGDLYKHFNTDEQLRVYDTPISEHGFAGIAIGAAFGGLRPIVEFMTFNFSLQAVDQIINSAAKTRYMSGGKINCPVVFRGPNGAAARVAAQHSHCLASLYAHIPGLVVIAPYYASDAKALLKAAIRDPNPVVFLENEIVYGFEHPKIPINEENPATIGEARVLQEGCDITIIGYSRMIHIMEQAAPILKEKHSIDAELIDLRTLRPLDVKTILKSFNKTHKLIVVEEGWPYGGVSAEIIALVNEHSFDNMDAPPTRLNGKDVPLPYAENLERLALPSVEDLLEKAIKLCRNI